MIKIMILLLLSIATFKSNSENFIEPKPIKWEELKEIQAGEINKSDTTFLLSPACSQDIESYKSMSKKTFIQNILWTTYVWYEYKLFDGLRCIIMVESKV